mmetsp:Transcript_11731/g.29690  ORF Transcript_11731/g.29690 Transcript_11731/m.29690 type:complete len:226 (+) Transcript_11731:233-910(+)
MTPDKAAVWRLCVDVDKHGTHSPDLSDPPGCMAPFFLWRPQDRIDLGAPRPLPSPGRRGAPPAHAAAGVQARRQPAHPLLHRSHPGRPAGREGAAAHHRGLGAGGPGGWVGVLVPTSPSSPQHELPRNPLPSFRHPCGTISRREVRSPMGKKADRDWVPPPGGQHVTRAAAEDAEGHGQDGGHGGAARRVRVLVVPGVAPEHHVGAGNAHAAVEPYLLTAHPQWS